MKIVVYIYNGMTMLDAIGPYEVLRSLKNAEILFVAKTKGEIKADSHSVHLIAKYSIDEVEEADILLIPGSSITFLTEAKDKKVLDWIKKIDATTQRTTTVCTGSIILAATGLLENKKATSHWKPIKMLTKYGAIPCHERFIQQGKYITAAGVSAGIDMALYLVDQLEGEDVARAAQLAIEYDPNPLFNSGNYLTADKAIIKKAEQQMRKSALKDLSFRDIIKNAIDLIRLR